MPHAQRAEDKQWSLESLGGLQSLSNEILRQAAMIGYLDAFHLMAFVALAAMPLAAFIDECEDGGREQRIFMQGIEVTRILRHPARGTQLGI